MPDGVLRVRVRHVWQYSNLGGRIFRSECDGLRRSQW